MSTPPTMSPSETSDPFRVQVLTLQAELRAQEQLVAQLTRERDQLRSAYEQLKLELELLKRRLFVAKAERVDTAQLELEFKDKLAALDALNAALNPAPEPAPEGEAAPAGSSKPPRPRPRPAGRRDLNEANLPKDRIEITDPQMEELCRTGQAERIGFEESSKLAWQRGGYRHLIVARVKYRVPGPTPETTTLQTAPVPPETFARSLAAPSLLAHLVVDKHCDGLPLSRIEDRSAREGVSLDRGTMSRWLEDAGATAGATVVEAARQEALSTAFCLATDATEVAIQPSPLPTGQRQPCRRGHFFVQIADCDHVFFEYTPSETSQAVGEMFRGYSGYVQADAKNVFDILFVLPQERKKKPPDEEPDSGVRQEVGCWSHARRKFWEAASAKCAIAREGLVRIGRLFSLEQQWRGLPPDQIGRLRQEHLRPHLEAFFEWAQGEYEKVRDQRGLLRTALGYALRQKEALGRVLDDGRLVLDNNRSERQLRRVAVGRKAWLFCGSDDHAAAAGHLMSLIASARLHDLDPEAYLRDLFRVLGQWPKDRYLELAPKYWARTRERLDPAQLVAEFGPLTIPPPLAKTAEEQPTSH